VRWLSDGLIEFLGRRDDQVKIRGQRVELGAIEAALTAHPLVEKAAAGVSAGPLEDRQLVGYLQCREQPPAVGELRAFLRARLPTVFVPEIFVVLPELPLSRYGKLDRAALATSRGAILRPERTHRPPRTPAEQLVADIWGDVLQLDEVSVGDNFYELGGDSLRAVTVFQRALEQGLLLPLEMLLGDHTIEQVAAAITDDPQLALRQVEPLLDA
jgi:hypothetical protein